MKLFKKITISYIAVMIAALVLMIYFFINNKVTNLQLGTYSNEELRLFKSIWKDMNDSILSQQKTGLEILIVFWAVIFIIGILFLFMIYWIELRPMREMEKVADQIAKGNLDAPLPVHVGNVFGNFAESFDLMREELKRSKEKEIDAERAKRELVAELSHDLKTPVATIQATCEVLDMTCRKKIDELEKSGKEEVPYTREDLEKIMEKNGYLMSKSETINSIVQNVFRATLDDMEELEINLSEERSDRIEKFIVNLKDYGNVILDNHIPECLVYMDPLRMEQVVDNIIGNSYKYAGTDIHVKFEEVKDSAPTGERQGNFIKVTIRDSGAGVPEDELPLVVEKYYRGKTVKEKQGYGLGMYLVNNYMEKQGGGMQYYNDNGFVVELFVKKV
ncbi:MAG: HAMP domain-containing histidine kinase [Eubacterium sp.]|nr:HAMP domain-containing histidine kinase [Eubacterium sp.]